MGVLIAKKEKKKKKNTSLIPISSQKGNIEGY
jgi:hypothetical protein